MARYRKRELAYWGIDLVKAQIIVPEGSILHGLSENSNQVFVEYAGTNLDITLEDNGVFRRYVVIRAGSVSVGFVAYNAIDAQKYDRFEITGQGLTLFGVEIFYFLFDFLGLEFVKFRRFDACFDMFISTDYFAKNILDEKAKKDSKYSFEQSRKFGVETMYFGVRDVKKNSYKLERIYNKVLDTRKKGKQFLYESLYLDESGKWRDVTRFEVECREDLAKFWKFDDLKNESFVYYRLVKSFWRKNVQFFKFLKDDDFFEFSRKYRDQKKSVLASILSGSRSASPMTKAQERLMNAMERKDHFVQWGNDFLTESDRKQCQTAFISAGKRLHGNGYSLEQLIELLKISLNMESIPFPNTIFSEENAEKK